jgi:hypothetical protein
LMAYLSRRQRLVCCLSPLCSSLVPTYARGRVMAHGGDDVELGNAGRVAEGRMWEASTIAPRSLAYPVSQRRQCISSTTQNPKLNCACPVSERRQHTSQEHKWHDGSTATFVMIQGTHLVCANVGDSRTIMCRLGKAIELSVDHKPSRPDERDRIIAAGGTISTVGVLRLDARSLSPPPPPTSNLLPLSSPASSSPSSSPSLSRCPCFAT